MTSEIIGGECDWAIGGEYDKCKHFEIQRPERFGAKTAIYRKIDNQGS